MFYLGLMLFTCSSNGCSNETATHFCNEHAVECVCCHEEHEASQLVDGACVECRRAECGDEMEMFVSAVCWCGMHKEVA